MKILVVDDGQLAINSLIRILCRVAPDCDYISAMTTDDALTWLRQGPMDANREKFISPFEYAKINNPLKQ